VKKIQLFEEVKKEEKETEYKDSEQAWFEEEHGEPSEIVRVIDEDENKVSIYTWERRKSNENINDTGTGKKGFSFYLARNVFYDEYFYLDNDLATNKNYTGIIGVIPMDKEKEELIVINIEDGQGVTRIISAYYADDPKYSKFVKKYWERREIMKKMKENMPFLSKEKLLRLQKLTEKWHSAN